MRHVSGGRLLVAAAFVFAALASGGAVREYVPLHCIQRTMKTLEESSAKHPKRVRVAFYGQSIVAQDWTRLLMEDLQRRYPHVKFEVSKRALGGYVSKNLVRTAEHDLYWFYPDITFFHVYGPMDKYEEIVRTLRERTTSEIVLWSSHLSAKDDVDAMLAKRDERTLAIAAVARKYHCMYVDLNWKWANLLKKMNVPAQALLSDGTHLKQSSLEHYARFIGEELRRVPGCDGEPEYSGTITEIVPKGNRIKFRGNRVVAHQNGKAKAEVDILLDGKRPTSDPRMWWSTRPSNLVRWMPALNRVEWKTAPVKEKWTLTFLEGTDPKGRPVKYSVCGSVTGEDGEGTSEGKFVSKSGRVMIDGADFPAWQWSYFKEDAKPGMKITWETNPLAVDFLKPNVPGWMSTIIQNCENGEHELEFKPRAGKETGILRLRIYAPPAAGDWDRPREALSADCAQSQTVAAPAASARKTAAKPAKPVAPPVKNADPFTISANPAEGGLEYAFCELRRRRQAGDGGEATIVLADGIYRLSKALKIDAANMGKGVRLAAQNRGKAVVSGSVPLPPLRPLADPLAKRRIPESVWGKVYEADLRGAGITDYGQIRFLDTEGRPEGMQLVYGGNPGRLARWPDHGYTAVIKGYGRNGSDGYFQYGDDRIDRWADEPDAHGNGFFCFNWHAARVKFAKIDPRRRIIRTVGRGSHYGYNASGYWFGYNLLCELDRPGEYYLDRERGKLFLYPDAPAGTAQGELTFADGLFELEGAENVSFDGVVLENCRHWLLAGKDCRNVRLTACTVRNSGLGGVRFERSWRVAIRGCDLYNLSGTAIDLRNCGDRMKLEHSESVVENCHIRRFGLDELTYNPAVAAENSCGVAVTRCTIHDAPHVAILFRGGRECAFTANEIHSVCADSGEMGAFYTGREWTLVGNVIANNYIHDLPRAHDKPTHAFMWDDGGAGLVVTNNIVRNVAEGVPFSAIGNVMDRNLFFGVPTPFTVWQNWTRSEQYKPGHYTGKTVLDNFYAVPFRSEPWKSRYPYLALIDDAIKSGKMRDKATRSTIRGNLIVDAGKQWIRAGFGGHEPTEETWLIEGNRFESGISFEEAIRLGGFPKLDEIGCHASPERIAWPVVHPLVTDLADCSYIEKSREAARAYALAHPDKRFKVIIGDDAARTFGAAEYVSSRYRAQVHLKSGKVMLDEVYAGELPIVISRHLGDAANSGALELDGEFVSMRHEQIDAETVRVTAVRRDGGEAHIDFDNDKFVIRNTAANYNVKPIFRPEIRRAGNVLSVQWNHKYGKVHTVCAFGSTPTGVRMAPAYGGITFDFSRPVK